MGSDAGAQWKAGKAAFDSGNYATAASDFNSIIHNSAPAVLTWVDNTDPEPPPRPPLARWLEPTFFMMGASYYNAKDWTNAILTFKRYLKLFRQSPHISEIQFSMAQANLLSGNPTSAIPFFTGLLPLPAYHEKCTLLLAESYKRAGNIPGAIAVFEKEKSQPSTDLDFLGKINIKLLGLYLDQFDMDKGMALLQEIDGDILHLQDITEFNKLAARLGDEFMAKNNISSALNCYRRVRNNDQVLAIEKLLIERLKQQISDNLVSIQANPLNSADLQLLNKDIQAQIDKDQSALIQYQTLPPILPPLFLRIGGAYSRAGQFWEAAVVYRELMRQFPQRPEAEAALYGSIIVFDQAKQIDRAQALCQTYLTQYPQGKYADSVGYLRGILAYDAEQFDQAITYFQDSLKNQPKNPRREQMQLIVGDIMLRQQRFDAAIAAYKQYQTNYPKGAYFEQATYRSALALLFGGKAEQADDAIRTYIRKYPEGIYVPDAEYRLDVIKFAAKEYNEVITDCVAWQQKYGDAGPLAEVLCLQGDCYASLDMPDDAVKAYTRSYKAAKTDEVLNYSLFAAAKILQQQRKWADISKMFYEFIKDNPDSPFVAGSVVWIGRADIKLGKVDEAKQFMAATAKQYLNDPTREAVDEILTQLAQLFAKKHLPLPPPAAPVPPASSAPPNVASSPTPGSASITNAAPVVISAPATNAVPVASSEPVAVPDDPAKDLENILMIPDLGKEETASARILYVKSELARFQRKPQIEQEILLEIADKFKPEVLSPALLAQVGDCLFQTGKPDQAEIFYHYLLDTYDQSPLVDYAYNGLGLIAYDQKDYKKALSFYSKALDKGVAATKLKEITLGAAQTFLALDRLDEAKSLFEQVASNRAWRGEATALSVFSLGEIQMRKQKYAEANAFYQHVFVAYQKYPAIQAKAYLKSGEAFENLGKIPEAVNTYNEMLRNPNLASFPEAQEVKQRLQNLVQK